MTIHDLYKELVKYPIDAPVHVCNNRLFVDGLYEVKSVTQESGAIIIEADYDKRVEGENT